jgi:hypothetical protein
MQFVAGVGVCIYINVLVSYKLHVINLQITNILSFFVVHIGKYNIPMSSLCDMCVVFYLFDLEIM